MVGAIALSRGYGEKTVFKTELFKQSCLCRTMHFTVTVHTVSFTLLSSCTSHVILSFMYTFEGHLLKELGGQRWKVYVQSFIFSPAQFLIFMLLPIYMGRTMQLSGYILSQTDLT